MSRLSLVLAVIVVILGYGYAQQNQQSDPLRGGSNPPGSGLPGTPQLPGTAAPQTPREKSLDQMLDELETLRAKKAEMEKSEQELIRAIQQKAGKQVERMKQLGIGPSVAKRVGRIIIEGNNKTTDGTILDLVDLHPGQVLDPNRLEEANARLKKAEKKRKFQSATVEVIPNEWDSIFLDILVKVKEKE